MPALYVDRFVLGLVLIIVGATLIIVYELMDKR